MPTPAVPGTVYAPLDAQISREESKCLFVEKLDTAHCVRSKPILFPVCLFALVHHSPTVLPSPIYRTVKDDTVSGWTQAPSYLTEGVVIVCGVMRRGVENG